MKQDSAPALVLLANSPAIFTTLGGISLLERCRRLMMRLGFRDATVITHDPGAVEAHLAAQTWRSNAVSWEIRKAQAAEVSVADIFAGFSPDSLPDRILIFSAAYYFDERLLLSLAKAPTTTVLVDSGVPFPEPAGESGAVLVTRDWLLEQDQNAGVLQLLAVKSRGNRVATLDAAAASGYVRSMRRELRPTFFGAPSPENQARAERFLRDATQKGVLDLPAYVHAPIEKWIVSHLCHSSITPNQLTIVTACLGLCVTLFYASGYLVAGVLLALVIGVLDGVDGKLARLKVQTTKIGKAEHAVDYFVELSWWSALAWWFYRTGHVPNAFFLLAALVLADFFERCARWSVEPRLGRSLDDLTTFDRFVRYVGGRRNIYTWLFALFLLLGAPAKGFVVICWWGVASAAIHVLRAAQIRIGWSLKGYEIRN